MKPSKTPTAKPSMWTDVATSTAVAGGKHAIASSVILSLGWIAAIIWTPVVTDAFLMAGVALAVLTLGHILIVVGHAAQLAEDDRQRQRDLDDQGEDLAP